MLRNISLPWFTMRICRGLKPPTQWWIHFEQSQWEREKMKQEKRAISKYLESSQSPHWSGISWIWAKERKWKLQPMKLMRLYFFTLKQILSMTDCKTPCYLISKCTKQKNMIQYKHKANPLIKSGAATTPERDCTIKLPLISNEYTNQYRTFYWSR